MLGKGFQSDTLEGGSMSTDHNMRLHVPLREKVIHVLEDFRFQVAIIALIILDCLIVIVELLIDLEIVVLGSGNYHISHALHATSVGILSLFFVEILVKLYAYRLGFFRKKMELFDAAVVIVSFSLDVAYWDNHDAHNGVGLIIILRLWRIARVLNGLVMSVKIQSEQRLHKERELRHNIEEDLARYREYFVLLSNQNLELRSLLKEHGISAPEVPAFMRSTDLPPYSQ